MEDAVRLAGVSKSFGAQQVIHDLELSLPYGQITGLLGPSGCGKTTIVSMIVGSLRPDSGEISLFGGLPLSEARGQIGFMPQDEALYNDLTAQENLRFFGQLYGLTSRQLAQTVPEMLKLMNLEDSANKTVANFSGGMKRRLSLAIACSTTPDCWFSMSQQSDWIPGIGWNSGRCSPPGLAPGPAC